MTAEMGLPIKRLTLYKHGVGFVERQGTVTGEEVELVFRADEVNDALKSLLVIDRLGGQIHGVHYQTPADQAALLGDSPIQLSPDHSLLDLLRSLRGWEVRLQLGSGSTGQSVAGRLLGVEVAEDKPADRALVAVLEEDGGVLVLPLGEVRQVHTLEPRAGQDLRYFLDISRSEDAHRTVTLRLSPGDHDLAVSYLVPSTTWRVSYRLVAESVKGETAAPAGSDATGQTPAPRTGKLLIQGWGLFDNRLEEDLEEVRVTLVAGQPISFIYDLAASRIPERPVVQDEARIAAAPVEFEGGYGGSARGMMDMAAEAAPAAAPMMMRAMLAQPAPAPPPATIGELAQQQVAAKGSESGELFQYEVVAPVTVKRGASALVPILNSQMEYRRELLFNEQKLPAHPVAAFRFTNETGLVLERGPVTVLEDGDYHGEAMVSFTKEGSEVYLAFAVELGIKVTQTSTSRTETVGIQIAGAILWLRQAQTTETTYRLDNSLGSAELVTIEHPIWSSYELVDTRAADAQTSDLYRWAVACPPRQATTFTVAQRTFTWQQTQVLDQSYASLRGFLKSRWLDQPTLDRIRSLMDERQKIARNNEEIAKLGRERQDIYNREEQLRKNMTALTDRGDEGKLRQQVVTQLQASEDRLRAIDTRVAALTEETTQRQATIEAELQKLKVEDTTAAKPTD